MGSHRKFANFAKTQVRDSYMSTLLYVFSTMSGFPGEVLLLSFALSIVIIHAPASRRRRVMRNAVFLLVAFLLFRLTGSIVKTGLAVPRPCWNPDHPSLIPCPKSFSFPSGHAVGSAMIAMIVGLIFRKKSVWIVGVVLSLFIAASRVALGVHTPLDAMGGLALGYAFGWISWRLFWHE